MIRPAAERSTWRCDGAAAKPVAGERKPRAGLQQLAAAEDRVMTATSSGTTSSVSSSRSATSMHVARISAGVTTRSPSATCTASPSISADSSSAARSGSGPAKSPASWPSRDDLGDLRAPAVVEALARLRETRVAQRSRPELDPQRPVIVAADRALDQCDKAFGRAVEVRKTSAQSVSANVSSAKVSASASSSSRDSNQ